MGSGQGARVVDRCGGLTSRQGSILFKNHLTRCTCTSVSSAMTTTLTLYGGAFGWGRVLKLPGIFHWVYVVFLG